MRHFLYTVSCFLLLVSSAVLAQAPNDECATATVVSALPYNTTQNSRLATVNVADPNISCNDTTALGKTVWYKYTPDADRFVYISTLGSTPSADFDIMLGVFTGTCGALTEVRCSDDAGGTRQSEVFMKVLAGTTYYILVGEWHGGGTSGGVPTGGDLVFKIFEGTAPQIVKGPKSGTAPAGLTVTTDNFTNAAVTGDAPASQGQINVPYYEHYELPALSTTSSKKYSNEFENHKTMPIVQDAAASSSIGRPVVQKGYQGFPMGNSIPPDPIMAVGPNHVIVMVNTSLRIFEKNGTLLKNITADAFFSAIAPGTGPNDPQIIYDHFASRWVMMWMTSPTATDQKHLFAVSDDSNPLGTWYQWSTSAIAVGDSATPNWGDYPALGYDSVALYLSSRQFPLAGGNFAYNKLRVIPKAQMYANSTAAISYKDFWDFRDPEQNAVFDGIRPPNAYSGSNKAFFVNIPPFNPTNYMTVWTLNDPIGANPSFTADNITVNTYRTPTQPQQLGGGTPLLESGSRQIRANVIYRDSALWAVHAVASGPNNEYSAVRYVKFNPFTKTKLEDVAFGANGYWYFYPAIVVNKDQDMMVTYSRSGLTEFPGAYISGRKKNDPAGLSTSVTMKEGAANYVLTFGGTRNRWGDYSGAALDPADQVTMWAHTEYASAKNTWGTWISSAKIGPLPGGIFSINRSFLEYGTKKVNEASDTLSVIITNDGLDTLTLSALGNSSDHFTIVNKPALPVKLAGEGVLTLKVVFKPTSGGTKKDSIVITTNDTNIPTFKVMLSGAGFQITKAAAGKLYAVSGSTDGGNLYIINTSTGTQNLVTKTEISAMHSLRVHPKTKELIAFNKTGAPNGGTLYRLSSDGVNSTQTVVVPIANLKGLAIYDDSMAYMGAFSGAIYKVNMNTGAATQIGTNGSTQRVGGLAINPVNGSLWMSLQNTGTGGTQDNNYKVNRTTGVSTLVGKANVGIGIIDIVFDKNGKLYGMSGTGTTGNKLIVIDTTNGSAYTIGDLGKADMQAIALDPDAIAAIAEKGAGAIPTAFALEQNYPNPFNPTTTIRFNIADHANVMLTVYDVIGREVARLADGMHQAGTYTVQFDASTMSSGVYYYKLSAGTFTDIKKMMILK
jgi:hypothetical protein